MQRCCITMMITMRVAGHRIKLTGEHMDLMRIPRRFWEASADKIPESVMAKAIAYVRDIETSLNDGTGLLLWGPNGTGKTSVAVFIAKEARRRGAPVLFVTAEGLRQGVIENRMFKGDVPLIDRARTVDVLLLDDFGKEHSGGSGYTERFYEDLLRQRSSRRLLTLITSNMGIAQLSERYKPSMIEVMKETVYPLKVDGPSQREHALDDLAKRLATG